MRIFILLLNLVIPAVMIVAGLLVMMKKPAETQEQVGKGLGFPGASARRTKDTWNFANSFGGSMCAIYGIYVIFATGFFVALMYRGWLPVVIIVTVVLIMLQLVMCLVIGYSVNSQLKHLFTEEGLPIDPEKVWKRRKFGFGFGKDEKTEADREWDAWNRDEWRDSWNEQWDDWDYWKARQAEQKAVKGTGDVSEVTDQKDDVMNGKENIK